MALRPTIISASNLEGSYVRWPELLSGEGWLKIDIVTVPAFQHRHAHLNHFQLCYNFIENETERKLQTFLRCSYACKWDSGIMDKELHSVMLLLNRGEETDEYWATRCMSYNGEKYQSLKLRGWWLAWHGESIHNSVCRSLILDSKSWWSLFT